MKRLFLVLGTAIMVLPWLTAARVQAEMIQWTASGSPIGPNLTNGSLFIEPRLNYAAGVVTLHPGPTTSGTNSGSIVALQVGASSNPDSSLTPTFGGPSANYSLSIKLTDAASGASGSLTFSGNLSGTFAGGGPDLTNTYLGPTTQTLKLGQNLYTVTMGSYVNGSGFAGSITGGTYGTISASISAEPATNSTPEPSSLLLACLGLPPLGLARWFRRRKAVGSDARNA